MKVQQRPKTVLTSLTVTSVSCRGRPFGGSWPPQSKILGGASFSENFSARAFGARGPVYTPFLPVFIQFRAFFSYFPFSRRFLAIFDGPLFWLLEQFYVIMLQYRRYYTYVLLSFRTKRLKINT